MSEKKFTIALRSGMKQRDIELYDIAFYSLSATPVLRFTAAHFGNMVRAAIEAQWFESPSCEVLTDSAGKKRYMFGGTEVGDLAPSVCYTAGELVNKLYSEATKTDPNLL